jgi:hypothetical protein
VQDAGVAGGVRTEVPQMQAESGRLRSSRAVNCLIFTLFPSIDRLSMCSVVCKESFARSVPRGPYSKELATENDILDFEYFRKSR